MVGSSSGVGSAVFGDTHGKQDARVQRPYGQAPVFTVSRNHDPVHTYDHFAVLADGTLNKLKLHWSQIALYSMIMLNGRDENTPNAFVRNLYDHFAPQHLTRILEAASTRMGQTDEIYDEEIDATYPSYDENVRE